MYTAPTVARYLRAKFKKEFIDVLSVIISGRLKIELCTNMLHASTHGLARKCVLAITQKPRKSSTLPLRSYEKTTPLVKPHQMHVGENPVLTANKQSHAGEFITRARAG